MLELKGKYGDAKVFTDNIDQETISQVIGLLNQPYAAERDPDHAGLSCRQRMCNRNHNDVNRQGSAKFSRRRYWVRNVCVTT